MVFRLFNGNFHYLLNIRAFSINFCKRKLTDAAERQEQKLLLQRYLGVSYHRSVILLRHNPCLQKINNVNLEGTLISFKKMGLDSEDIFKHPLCLTFHSNTVEHNMKYLKELGFIHISAAIFLRFRTIVKKPIYILKAHGIIPEDNNVADRLYSYLTPRQDCFPILMSFSDKNSIVHIHEIIFKHYLAWRLETTLEIVNKIFKTYDGYKYKSFELISRMITFLTDNLKFPFSKVLQHGYLLQITDTYPEQIIKHYPQLGGVDIKTVLYRYPKIIGVPYENIAEINSYLKDFNISEEAIYKCFDIYTLTPSTVLSRLNELTKVPEFRALSKNKRILQLIICQNKAKSRLEQLHRLKLKCFSINMLCGTEKIFEKHTVEGNDKTKGIDLVNFLNSELKAPVSYFRNKMSENPYWYQISLVTVQDSLNFLLKLKFGKNYILKVPIILLYPAKKISHALEEIRRHPNMFNTKLTATERLNLCLYFIEKKHHFSGDGVWDNEILDEQENKN